MYFDILSFFLTFSALSASPGDFSQEVLRLEEDSFNRADLFIKDKGFQDLVNTIPGIGDSQKSCAAFGTSVGSKCSVETMDPHPQQDDDHGIKQANPQGNFFVFVSFSLGEKALLNLAEDAKRFGVTLVLRGFKDGSYVKTAHALQKIILKTGQGVTIDPELFSLFDIQVATTFVLSKPFPIQATDRIQTPLHDRLQGHVSFQYALETFAKAGTLKNEAKALLKSGGIK